MSLPPHAHESTFSDRPGAAADGHTGTAPALVADRVTVLGGQGREARLFETSLSLETPGVIALVGPNGAGKSTLLRVLAGLIRPDRGTVRLGGRDLYTFPPTERARHLTLVGAAAATEVALTVEETVALGRLARRHSLWDDPIRQNDPAVESALERTDLVAMRYLSLTEISSGERQRVHLGRAVAQEANCLMLDEPTAYLDPGHARRLWTLVRAMADDGLRIAVAVHDLTAAGQYADRVVLLYRGRVVTTGTPDGVLDDRVLSPVYETHFRIVPHPDTGRPVVLAAP